MAEVVRTVECNSSRWVREKCPIFQWQQGYGAFSVSPSQVERVKQYVRNQAEHHRTRSFEDEFVAMLEAARLSYKREQAFG